ncbi:MAG: SUF system Fe-S cluster assembly regulator [Candidatus Delongbacteria bacterium]
MLRITKQTDYGIVLMTLFATRRNGEARSARDLALETGLPLPMVGKILKLLVRDGLLASQRGARGGYRLGRPAGLIFVADIVRALEGPIAITECVETGPGECRFLAGCSLQPNWVRINQAIQQALQGISLEDMAPAEGDGCGAMACGGGVSKSAQALRQLAEGAA